VCGQIEGQALVGVEQALGFARGSAGVYMDRDVVGIRLNIGCFVGILL